MKWLWILSFSLLVFGCSKSNQTYNQQDQSSDSGLGLFRNKVQQQIIVVDEFNLPVPGARILIGDQVGSPFKNNLLMTSLDGKVAVPGEWTQKLSISVFKIGYINATYLNQSPKSLKLVIKRQKSETRLELNGKVDGFPELKTDGFIDFALVIPALTASSALNYDIADMVSPELDTIKVMGYELKIPTNVFLPKQKENYGIIPINLEKSFFRVFFDTPNEYTVHATRGKFDFKKVSEKLKGGASFFDAVNDFQFLTVGSHKVKIETEKLTQNLQSSIHNLNTTVGFNFNNPQTEKLLFGVSFFEENDRLIAGDIKLRQNNMSQSLSYPVVNSAKYALLALTQKEKGPDGKQDVLSQSMTTTLVASDKISQAFLLDEIEKPVADKNGLSAKAPLVKNNLRPFATYATLSDVELIQTNSYTFEKKTVKWEIYASEWVESIQLPQQVELKNKQFKRWDIVYYGLDTMDADLKLNNTVFVGPESLNQATHAVHNAIDFN